MADRQINSPNGFTLKDGRKIPENRTVKILGAESKPIVDVPLFYDGELSLKVGSKFGSIWDAEGNNLLTLLSGSTDGAVPSGQFSMQGTQIWQSTDPMTLDLTLQVYMIDNALEDVVKPVLTLMSTCLPTKSTMLDLKVASANVHLETLIPPGPNLQSIIKSSGSITSDSKLFNDFLNKGSRGVYSIQLGKNILIPKIIITSAEPTFSKWTDENGNPVSAQVSLSITTMEIATTDMVSSIWKTAKQSDLGGGV